MSASRLIIYIRREPVDPQTDGLLVMRKNIQLFVKYKKEPEESAKLHYA